MMSRAREERRGKQGGKEELQGSETALALQVDRQSWPGSLSINSVLETSENEVEPISSQMPHHFFGNRIIFFFFLQIIGILLLA